MDEPPSVIRVVEIHPLAVTNLIARLDSDKSPHPISVGSHVLRRNGEPVDSIECRRDPGSSSMERQLRRGTRLRRRDRTSDISKGLKCCRFLARTVAVDAMPLACVAISMVVVSRPRCCAPEPVSCDFGGVRCEFGEAAWLDRRCLGDLAPYGRRFMMAVTAEGYRGTSWALRRGRMPAREALATGRRTVAWTTFQGASTDGFPYHHRRVLGPS